VNATSGTKTITKVRRRPVAREWRHRLAPDALSRRPKGMASLWVRARRLFWSWWVWALVCVSSAVYDQWGWALGMGVLSLVTYLIQPTEFPPRYGLDHAFTVESDTFLETVSGATGVWFVKGNRVEILNNGDQFYPAMLEAIAEARSSVTIEAYIYWAGRIGLTFARALADRARAGVKVKILLDAVGSSSIGEEILKTLEAGGCQLAWYNPIRWYSLGRFNHRTHRKSLVVDGRVGFTGGAGIADVWLGDAEDPGHWRDVQIRLEGPAVRPLQSGFAQNWLETTSELISGARYYPDIDEPAGVVIDHTPDPKAGPGAPAAGPPLIAAQTIMSSPETGTSTVRIMYYLSIISASRSIFIANPYFVPDQVAIDTLIEAKQRGVDVRIMVSGIHNDNWLARRNSVRLYGPLLAAGIGILEYNRTMLHHKTMVVDEIWGTVGTTNFDNRSFAHNEENNVCFHDRALASALHQTFLADQQWCRRIQLAEWRKRGLWARSLEFVASFLQDQI
jgi:cardiolipin synthase